MFGSFLTLLILFALYSGWLYYQQPHMIFFPSRELVATPNDWGLPYEDVTLHTVDGATLHGWYIPHAGAQHTLLFFHGNAGNISQRGDSVAIFQRLGMNVLIVDYRGYGRSTGKPSERGLYEDARSAWQYLTQQRDVAPHNIILFGRSLGGAVAAKLASEVQPRALILESTFSSAKDLAHSLLPLQSRLTPLRFDFNTAQLIRNINLPLLLIHSREDDIIPYPLGKQIYDAANPPNTLLTIKGPHNGGFLQSQPGYEQALAAFIAIPPTAGITPPTNN